MAMCVFPPSHHNWINPEININIIKPKNAPIVNILAGYIRIHLTV